MATITSNGILYCSRIDADQTVMITATFSSGGVTRTASMDVTLVNEPTDSFTPAMVSGNVFYEENLYGGGASDSSLFRFNTDSTYEEHWYESSGGQQTAGRRTGTWSIDSSGNLVVVTGQGSLTRTHLSDTSTGLQVVVDDGGGTPVAEFVEMTVPVDPAKMPGTYRVTQNGETWTFLSDGTGSTSGAGGWTFTWSVDSGILKTVFSNGYAGWFHARATSESTASAYTLLKAGFTEYTPSGGFYSYYGGRALERQ